MPGAAGPGEFVYIPGSMGGGSVGRFQQLGVDPGYAQTFAAAQQAAASRENTRAQQSGETERARIAADAATAGERGKQQRFDTLSRMLFGGGAPGGFGGGMGPGTPGSGGQNFMRFPSGPNAGQLAAPPGVPGSVFGGAGGMGGGGGVFGGGGLFGGGPPGQFGVDRTLPSFSENPFSRSRLLGAQSAAGAQSDRQLGSEMKNIEESATGRGFAAGSPQTLALQSIARQRGLSDKMANQRDISNQFAAGGAGLEMQREGLTAQRRSAIDENLARMMQADAARQNPMAGIFSSFLSSAI